jgi:hypothetical protein
MSKSKRSAPAPKILGLPSREGAECDFCREPATHLVRLYQPYDAPPGKPFDDWDLCEDCYLLERKCAAEPDGGKAFLESWPALEEGDDCDG